MHTSSPPPAGGEAAPPLHRGALGAWWWQGLRSACLLAPHWAGLRATPGLVAVLVTAPLLAGIGLQRLFIDGPAMFYAPGLTVGWLSTAAAAWTAWLLVPQERDESPASAAALFAMLAAQSLALVAVFGIAFVGLLRGGFVAMQALPPAAAQALGIAPTLWSIAAQVLLLWRSGGSRHGALRLAACGLTAAIGGSALLLEQPRLWYPLQASSASEAPPPRLTPALIEQQQQALHDGLAAIGPRTPGRINLYAITYAPYAGEDVFRNESRLVGALMRERWQAGGKQVELINHAETIGTRPWATPSNLQRAIRRAAAMMDRDEDVLFLHLTSHGARNGRLSTDFEPLEIDSVTPALLRGWLDEAGIRFRIVSISACYSGSWIEPLADAGTLVMTAADAEHTSYGCGRGAELTYFGRAMYGEALRRTHSFEQAHAEARRVIERREREAGKSDGYSNPQIRIGEAIRPRLAQLGRELDAP